MADFFENQSRQVVDFAYRVIPPLGTSRASKAVSVQMDRLCGKVQSHISSARALGRPGLIPSRCPLRAGHIAESGTAHPSEAAFSSVRPVRFIETSSDRPANSRIARASVLERA
jgi:hypothetical protein